MATQKISEMTEAIILQDEDYAPIIQSDLNKKIKIELLRDYNKLHNKPTLNGVTIENNKNLADYNITQANQGIKINDNTKQTLELETLTATEMEQRAEVNKAVTVATADKMAKETAHQQMSKDYLPNTQDKLTEGEKQPVSYKAVKDYVDVLENKVDENERDIEAKVIALDQKTSQKDEELEELINTNEQDIEQKVSSLQETVNNNKQNIEQKINTLEQKVDTNETDIEEKVRIVNENIDTIETNIGTIETNIDNLNNKDNEIIDIINYGGKISNGNEYYGEASDYGIELYKAEGNYKQKTTNGYQLFDASKLPTKSQGGATVTNNGDGSFTVSGSGNLSESFTFFYRNDELLKKLKVGNITLNYGVKTYPYFGFLLKDSNNIILLEINNRNVSQKEITQEVLEKTTRVDCGFYGSKDMDIVVGTIKPMLYQDGDGTWEEYTGGMPSPNPEYPQEIKSFEVSKVESVGKNLIKYPYIVGEIGAKGNVNGIAWEVLHDKSVKIVGTATGEANVALCKIDFGNTYLNRNVPTANGYVVSGHEQNFHVFYNSQNKTTAIYIPTGVKVDTIVYPQIEKGTKATSWEQPKGYIDTPMNMTLRALPNGTKDTYENSVITRRVGVVEFDGSDDENWYLKVYNDTFIRFDSNRMPTTIKINGDGLSNRFIKSNNDDYMYDKEFFRYSVYQKQAIVVIIRKDRLETPDVEGFKKFLQQNPSIFWFELENSTTEQITLPTIPSYYPFTNVWHDSEVESDIEWHVNTYRNGNFDDYYNKNEVDEKLKEKAPASHAHTPSQVGLGNVPNVKTNDQVPTYTQASTLLNLVSGEKLSVSLGKVMKAIADLISHIGNKSNPHGVTKAQVGLSNVTNDSQVKRSEMGKASGVATLDTSGRVPSSQLPSYVDDVLSYANKSSFPSTGETGKIYVDTATNKTYRWSGSAYVEISASLALGETSSTAYAGDKGKSTADKVNAIMAGTTKVPKATTADTATNANNANTLDGKDSTAFALKSYVDGGLRSRQLLINNDFQINQRGQSEYVVTNGNWEYTLDMWKFRGVSNSTVSINEDKTITLTNPSNENSVYFCQALSDLVNGNYSGNIKVISIIGIVKFYINGTTLEGQNITLTKGINTFSTNGTPSTFNIQLYAGASITLEYIDLFEGDIAYPHVKEDYAIALDRCQRYFQKRKILCGIAYIYNAKDLKVYGEIPSMIEKPLISIESVKYVNASSEGGNLDSVREAFIDNNNGLDARIVLDGNIHSSLTSLLLDVTLSCEPL